MAFIEPMHRNKPNITYLLGNNLPGNSKIAKFMGPTWGPPGSCRPQMGPMLAPWTLLSGLLCLNWWCAGCWLIIASATYKSRPSDILPRWGPSRRSMSYEKIMGLLALYCSPMEYKRIDIVPCFAVMKVWDLIKLIRLLDHIIQGPVSI